MKPHVSTQPETYPCPLRTDPAISDTPSPELGAEPLVNSQRR